MMLLLIWRMEIQELEHYRRNNTDDNASSSILFSCVIVNNTIKEGLTRRGGEIWGRLLTGGIIIKREAGR
jgi:hypothetical protein